MDHTIPLSAFGAHARSDPFAGLTAPRRILDAELIGAEVAANEQPWSELYSSARTVPFTVGRNNVSKAPLTVPNEAR